MSDRALEICCDSLGSARAAADGGADRIELCADLAADGVTPEVDDLRAAVEVVPTFVLVRCRPGDFTFTGTEIDTMCDDIRRMCEAGAAGIVSGALLESGEIDVEATRRLLGAARGTPFTFHKAFDLCPDQESAMRQLVGLGIDRVLTSGGQRYAVDAIDRLARLAEIGGGTTRVLCGGGVRAENLARLVEVPAVDEFHSAARPSVDRPVSLGDVRAMRRILDGAR